MNKIIRNTIRTNLPGAFTIEGNRELFDRIVSDQEIYSGNLRPARNWDLAIGGQEGQHYFYSQNSDVPTASETNPNKLYDKFSSLQKMMDPFVGCTGLKSIDKNTVQEYFAFLERIDHLNILPNYFDSDGELNDQANDLIVTDLGSILDINIITSFLDPTVEKYYVLEVGGGYGRLAEVFLNIYERGNIKYVLVDAVPASLMYSYLYLSNKFPDLRIGFYYRDDPFDMDQFDCYIMPSWHFNISANRGLFDCCINIQSMQEMNQYHVDYYIRMFDEIIKDNSGIIYISNEKDYIFQGEWNYPATWRCLFKTRTPRSWTRNSPTELFIKGPRSFDSENNMVDSVYSLQLQQLDKSLENHKLISTLQHELRQAQLVISDLHSKLLVMPLVSEEPTIEKVEERIRGLNEYYSKDLPSVIRLFKNISKISVHLVAINIYLRKGRYRNAFSHLLAAGRLDPFILFSIQTFRIIGNGLSIRLKRI